MKFVLVSFTLFYSATCALVLSVISHYCLRGVHVLREALVVAVQQCDTAALQQQWVHCQHKPNTSQREPDKVATNN